MDDGQRYRDQSSQPVRALLVVAAWPRAGSPRGAGQSGLRAEPRGGRPAGPPRADRSAPQFAKRLAQRGFR